MDDPFLLYAIIYMPRNKTPRPMLKNIMQLICSRPGEPLKHIAGYCISFLITSIFERTPPNPYVLILNSIRCAALKCSITGPKRMEGLP